MSGPGFLSSQGLRLLLFGGKGGVGKTTCAVASSLALARRFPDKRLVLISTDPAHSLQDSLAQRPVPAKLEVIELDAQEHLESFRRRHGGHLKVIADRGTFLDSEDIDRFLSLSLPGMDELFGFLDLARRAHEASGDECLVVDTAPSGHTLRLLAMPELLRGWVDVLDTLLAKHRYMKQLFARAYRPDDVDGFLDELSESIATAEELLHDRQRCRFVPVMIAEELSVRETAALLGELARLGIAADELVVNMLAPATGCADCAGTRPQQTRTLSRLPGIFRGRTLWGATLRATELRGSELESFWDEVTPLEPRASAAALELPEPAALAAHPAPLPPPTSRLLLFAGKGGVGKTTLACATAIRLAREAPQRRILLFSTDPAHSLADCLDRPVGPQMTAVTAGLVALEMDAAADLEALKRQYRQEIDELFGSLLGSFDAPFDRAVMERLIELAPPGLDEIMAVTDAMGFLAEFELLILDSAPTGHLVRLLEMPQLVDDWLKAFFELFLKYREVLRMPSMAERLVQLSKELRGFRALLRDPARAALYAVSIPTRMALEETRDLLSACGRIGVSVPVLFLNLRTPPSECEFCARRAGQERDIEQELARSLATRPTVVFRGPEPRGLERLEKLGGALYSGAQRGDHRDARV